MNQLTAGDPANTLSPHTATSSPLLTVKSYIKGLAIQSHATTSNTGGPSYLLLGMYAFSVSSKANGSDVYT